MIVLDASVVVELLTNGALAESIRRELNEHNEHFLVPHLLDVEVLSALRRLAAGKRIDTHRHQQFLHGLISLPAERCAHTLLAERIWELRHNFSAYDAAYIALAEATESVLYTCDSKLAAGHHASVRVFQQAGRQ